MDTQILYTMKRRSSPTTSGQDSPLLSAFACSNSPASTVSSDSNSLHIDASECTKGQYDNTLVNRNQLYFPM